MIKVLRAVVLVFGVVIQVQAQEVTVSGTVTAAADGVPLPGVSIRLNGSGQGTVTDLDGVYTLTATATDTLLFTFVGFNPHREPVGQRSVINVTLQEESTELGEVVITGFQEVQRKLFTGSATNLKMSDVKITGMTD